MFNKQTPCQGLHIQLYMANNTGSRSCWNNTAGLLYRTGVWYRRLSLSKTPAAKHSVLHCRNNVNELLQSDQVIYKCEELK